MDRERTFTALTHYVPSPALAPIHQRGKPVAMRTDAGVMYGVVSVIKSHGARIELNPIAGPVCTDIDVAGELTTAVLWDTHSMDWVVNGRYVLKADNRWLKRWRSNPELDERTLIKLVDQSAGSNGTCDAIQLSNDPLRVVFIPESHIKDIAGHFDKLFNGHGIFQPGVVVRMSVARRIAELLDMDDLRPLFNANEVALKGTGDQWSPPCLASLFGEIAVHAAKKHTANIVKDVPVDERMLQREGIRVLATEARANRAIPEEAMGSILRVRGPIVFIQWDTGVLEMLDMSVAADVHATRSVMAMVANVHTSASSAPEDVVATMTMPLKYEQAIAVWLGAAGNVSIQQPARAREVLNLSKAAVTALSRIDDARHAMARHGWGVDYGMAKSQFHTRVVDADGRSVDVDPFQKLRDTIPIRIANGDMRATVIGQRTAIDDFLRAAGVRPKDAVAVFGAPIMDSALAAAAAAAPSSRWTAEPVEAVWSGADMTGGKEAAMLLADYVIVRDAVPPNSGARVSPFGQDHMYDDDDDDIYRQRMHLGGLTSLVGRVGSAIKSVVTGTKPAAAPVVANSDDPTNVVVAPPPPPHVPLPSPPQKEQNGRGIVTRIGDALGNVGDTIEAKFGVPYDEDVSPQEAEEECPPSVDTSDPAAYRGLDRRCCTIQHGLKWTDPSFRRSRKDSGCYDAALDEVRGDGIYRKSTNQKLTAGAAAATIAASTSRAGAAPPPLTSAAATVVSALTPDMMAAIAMSIRDDKRAVGVRSDGRIITSDMVAPLSSWVASPGITTLIKRVAIPDDRGTDDGNGGSGGADLPVLATSGNRTYSVIENAVPFDWPLILPVPELRGDIGGLHDLAAARGDVIAFHDTGLLYLSHPSMSLSSVWSASKFPRARNPADGGSLFILTDILVDHYGGGGATTSPPQPLDDYSPDLAEWVFFPGVFMPSEGFVHTTLGRKGASVMELVSVATRDTNNILAFDTDGRAFHLPLPLTGKWDVRRGVSAQTGTFIRRGTPVLTLVPDDDVVVSVAAGFLAVGEPQTVLTEKSGLRGVALAHSDVLAGAKGAAWIKAAMPDLPPKSKTDTMTDAEVRRHTERDAARALFFAPLPQFSGKAYIASDAVTTALESGSHASHEDVALIGGENSFLLETMRRDMAAVEALRRKTEQMGESAVVRIRTELNAVRARIERVRGIIQAYTSPDMAMDASVSAQLRNAVASQRGQVEAVISEMSALVMDMPHEVQMGADSWCSNLTASGPPQQGVDSFEDIMAIMASSRAWSTDKAREFAFMLPAMFVHMVATQMRMPMRAATLRLDRQPTFSTPLLVRSGSGGANGATPNTDEVVVVNTMRTADGSVVDMQQLMLVLRHTASPPTVDYVIMDAMAAGVTRESVDAALRSALPGYTIVPQPPVAPKVLASCTDVPQPALMAPLAAFWGRMHGSGGDITCDSVRNFVAAVSSESRRDRGVQDAIRLAHSQIHVVQDTITRCGQDPAAPQCRTLAFNVADVARARAQFAVGDYRRASVMMSDMPARVPLLPLLPSMAASAAAAPLRAPQLESQLMSVAAREWKGHGPLKVL